MGDSVAGAWTVEGATPASTTKCAPGARSAEEWLRVAPQQAQPEAKGRRRRPATDEGKAARAAAQRVSPPGRGGVKGRSASPPPRCPALLGALFHFFDEFVELFVEEFSCLGRLPKPNKQSGGGSRSAIVLGGGHCGSDMACLSRASDTVFIFPTCSRTSFSASSSVCIHTHGGDSE